MGPSKGPALSRKTALMKGYSLFLLAGALCLASCGGKPSAPIVRPVKVIEITADLRAEKTFPGYVEAEEYAFVNFRVGGMLEALNVDQGQNVRRGQLIARLDPRDFQLRVASTKASFDQASSQLERYKILYAREAISRQEYEMAQATYENDRATYNQALNDLSYTRLTAPFDGNVEAKYVENFQQVAPGQRIVKLTNPDKLQFRFTLPENDLAEVGDSTRWGVAFDAAPDRYYAARIDKQVASSVGGGGVPVVLVITDPAFDARKLNVMPGYACDVRMETPGAKSGAVIVPLPAIYADPQTGAASVWKVAADSTVHLAPVTAGEILGNEGIFILSGLHEGDRVVTAGVTLLSEGEKVKILTENPSR